MPRPLKKWLPRRNKSSLSTPEPSRNPSPSAVPSPAVSAQPSQTVSGPALTTAEPEFAAVPIEEGPNYGIRVLHDGGKEACVDIVFVHGLTGHAYKTWLYQNKETKIHWPSQLLSQDIPDSRILSYGYDADIFKMWGGPASNSRLSNHAEGLVGKLVRLRERTNTETRKIAFVAHSLGGLVTEQALVHSKNSAEEHLKQIERFTTGIVFLGVPHCGSDLEAWASIGSRMASLVVQTNKDIVKVLNPNSEMLHIVENSFHSIVRQRRMDDPVEITCFFEELGVKGIGEVMTYDLFRIV